MKLRNTYIICKENYNTIDKIDFLEAVKENNIGEIYVLNEYGKVLRTVEQLSNIDCLKDASLNLLNVVSLKGVTRPLASKLYNKEACDQILRGKSFLLNRMNCIIELYESMDIDEKENEKIGLDIKLPESNDFTEFKKNISDLEFVLTKCPFFKNEKEDLRFKSIDVGSQWLTFLVTGVSITLGSVLLNNIAAFIDKCMIIRSHKLSIEMQKEQLKKTQEDNKEKEIILKYLTTLHKNFVDNEIKKMEEICNEKIKDGDERGRFEQCIGKLINLIDKGLQIYSTIDSPKEIKALFEPLKMKYLIVSEELKLLEKKEKDSDEKEEG